MVHGATSSSLISSDGFRDIANAKSCSSSSFIPVMQMSDSAIIEEVSSPLVIPEADISIIADESSEMSAA